MQSRELWQVYLLLQLTPAHIRIQSQRPLEASVETPEPVQVIPATESDTDTSAGVIEKLNAELTTKSTASPVYVA